MRYIAKLLIKIEERIQDNFYGSKNTDQYLKDFEKYLNI